MNMVIPDEAQPTWVGFWVSWLASNDPPLRVMLFKNTITIDTDTVFGDLTFADFTGYAAFVIDNSDWSASAVIGNVTYLTYATPPEFTCTGGASQTVYGWALVDIDNSLLLAAANFDTPRTMTSGASETLDPFRIGLTTL